MLSNTCFVNNCDIWTIVWNSPRKKYRKISCGLLKFLLEIYPARELPIEGVDSEWLLGKIKSPIKKLISKSEIVREITDLGYPVFITIGAGDIGVEISQLKEKLSYAY